MRPVRRPSGVLWEVLSASSRACVYGVGAGVETSVHGRRGGNSNTVDEDADVLASLLTLLEAQSNRGVYPNVRCDLSFFTNV